MLELDVLSVTCTFNATVALVAVVAELALPVNAPTKLVEVTLDKPANVVELEPNEIAVVPTVMLEFTSAPLGILVKLAPEPTKDVAVNAPVLGLN